MGGRCVARDRQGRACVVPKDAGAIERGIRRRCGRVVCGERGDRDRYGRGRCLSAGIGCDVGERVRSAVARCRRVGVGAISSHRDGAVARLSSACHREPYSDVVPKNARAVQRGVDYRRDGVVERHRRHRERNRCRRRLSAGIRRGIGERVGSRVPGCWGVCVRAVGTHDNRTVGRGGVAGNGESGADIVGQNAGAGECSVCRSCAGISGGNRVHHYRHRGGCGLSACVGGGIGKRVGAAVANGRRIGKRAI